MTILEMFDEIGLPYTHKTGNEYSSPCPFCGGGSDRFLTWLDDKTPDGRFWCRRCGQKGQASRFQQLISLLDTDEVPNLKKTTPSFKKTFSPILTKPDPTNLPYDYTGFIDCAKANLKGMIPTAYLLKRGITIKTAEHFNLGYYYLSRNYKITKPDGKRLYLPAGITIPNYRDGKLCSAKVRCFGGDETKRYINLTGCKVMPFIAQASENTNLPVLIIESDFDAMLLWQELGSLFSAYISLGSSTARPNDADVHKIITNASKTFFCPDNDEAGFAAYESWKSFYPTIELAQLPQGKDPTEALQHGVDLKAWGISLRKRTEPITKPFTPTPTPCVTITTYEALLSYIKGKEIIGVDYDPVTDQLSFSNGETIAFANLKDLGEIHWQDDFAETKLVTFDAVTFQHNLPCPLVLHSLRYFYHALTGAGESATLEKLTITYLGLQYPADLRSLLLIYRLLLAQHTEDMGAAQNTYRFLNAVGARNHAYLLHYPQHAVAQMMRNGIPFDTEKSKEIVTDSTTNFSGWCREDGRIYPYYNLFSSVTGRITTQNPPMQSLPTELKAAVVAPEGYVFVDADYKQSEIRIAAELAKDQTLLDMLNAGRDCHTEVMASILGRKPTAEERAIGKTINFGHLYGQTLNGMVYSLKQKGIEVPDGSVGSLYTQFEKMFPKLMEWAHNKVKKVGDVGGNTNDWGVRTAVGRFIPLLARVVYRWEQKVVNWIVQGSGAELMLHSLSVLPRHLKGLNAKILICVHDEILIEASESDADRALQALTDAMTEAYIKIFRPEKVDNLVDAHIGKTWLEAKQG